MLPRTQSGPIRAIALLLLAVASALAAPESPNPELVALPPRWPDPIADYRIEAKLDPSTHRITARQHVTWRNRSSTSVPDLQFHLYLNAFKNTRTTYMRESLLENPNAAEDFQQKWGWIDITSLKLVSGEDLTGSIEFIQPDDGNKDDQTVARVVLPRPVAPGESVELDMEFIDQLPLVIERTGYHETFHFVAQWFPKLGVFEDRGMRGRTEPGWNCHQFHSASEFYADFGTYDVSVTLPESYVFGSTGVVESKTQNGDGTITYTIHQEHVHDFTWTASPDYISIERPFRWRDWVSDEELAQAAATAGITIEQAGLRDVTVRLLTHQEHLWLADRQIAAVCHAIERCGLRFGAYPYDQVTVVDPTYGGRGSDGMEYPMLITVGAGYIIPSRDFDMEKTAIHEFAHQYWYGMLANNEFEESWIDEGLTSYTEGAIADSVYPLEVRYERPFNIPVRGVPILEVEIPFADVSVPLGAYFTTVPYASWQSARARYLRAPTADPMLRSAWLYRDRQSYGLNSYGKPEAMLHSLERYLGEKRFTRAMRTFQMRWRFRHPSTADFIAVFNEASGEDLSWFFDPVILGSGTLDYAVGKVESDQVPEKLGVFDGPSGRSTVTEPDEPAGDGPETTRVVVERRGDVVVPVEVLARFDDGGEQLQTWDGVDRWQAFSFTSSAKLVSVEVDPYGRWAALDVNLINNGRRIEPDAVAVNRWSASALFWFQSLLAELVAFS